MMVKRKDHALSDFQWKEFKYGLTRGTPMLGSCREDSVFMDTLIQSIQKLCHKRSKSEQIYVSGHRHSSNRTPMFQWLKS